MTTTPPHNEKTDKIKGYVQLALIAAFIIGSFLVSFLLTVTKQPIRTHEVPERVSVVDVIQVAPASHRIKLDATGMVQARANITLTPEVSGRVIMVNNSAFKGGSFQAGELLFQIDPSEYQLEVKRLEALVAQATTAYNVEEAESKIAREEWRRMHGDKAIPPLVARQPQMDQAWAELKSAKAQLERAVLDLEDTVFSLPFSGRIVSSDLSVGQYLNAGESYGTAYEMEELEVDVSLDKKSFAWLMKSSRPEITITTHYQGETQHYKGYVKRNAADLDSKTRLATVTLGFSPNAGASRRISAGLIPGVFADVHIKGSMVDDVIAVPHSALQKTGEILSVNPMDSTVSARKADIVFADGHTLLLSGYKGAQLIVTNKVFGSNDGMKVRYNIKQPDMPSTSQMSEEQASLSRSKAY